jgi:hypothetical protein
LTWQRMLLFLCVPPLALAVYMSVTVVVYGLALIACPELITKTVSGQLVGLMTANMCGVGLSTLWTMAGCLTIQASQNRYTYQ